MLQNYARAKRDDRFGFFNREFDFDRFVVLKLDARRDDGFGFFNVQLNFDGFVVIPPVAQR